MIRIIISGCSGKMGRVLSACAAERTDFEIAGGIARHTDDSFPYPVFSAPPEINVETDAVIDFSNPDLLPALIRYAEANQTPLVLCTTGYSSAQVELLHRAAQRIPVFYSGNTSIGVNLLIELAEKAARVLGDGFDAEVIEMHHNQKVDAPSGTALMIADGISSAREERMRYVYDRHSRRKKRDPSEIGIHSVRGGTIVGEHEVIFAGPHEVIRLSHSAQSKEIFALGALNAAAFLVGKPAGLYHMADLLK